MKAQWQCSLLFLWWLGLACCSGVCESNGSASLLLCAQGLSHLIVEGRGWHSAAVTVRFPSAEAAVASLMTWHTAASLTAAGEAHRLLGHGGSSCQLDSSGLPTMQLPSCHATNSNWRVLYKQLKQPAAAGAAESVGDVGVFWNHPGQGGYLPNMPQLLVLSLKPSMGRLGKAQRQLVAQQLVAVQQQVLLELAGSAGAALAAGAGWESTPGDPPTPLAVLQQCDGGIGRLTNPAAMPHVWL